MLAARRCVAHAKPWGADITSKRKDTQKPEEKQKWHITGNGSTTAIEQRKWEAYVWTDNKAELLLNITLEY